MVNLFLGPPPSLQMCKPCWIWPMRRRFELWGIHRCQNFEFNCSVFSNDRTIISKQFGHFLRNLLWVHMLCRAAHALSVFSKDRTIISKQFGHCLRNFKRMLVVLSWFDVDPYTHVVWFLNSRRRWHRQRCLFRSCNFVVEVFLNFFWHFRYVFV